MAYISDLATERITPAPDKISLERYILEDSYITKYLSRIVKDKALVIYHVLFTLSWYENGNGEISVPWKKLGKYIVSEKGNLVQDSSTIKRRLPDLINHKCITISQQRSSANKIFVHLPSDIKDCKRLIEKEEGVEQTVIDVDVTDYYTDSSKRKLIYERDKGKCVYCLIELSEDLFVLDHLIPLSKGGTNKKFNLVTSCEKCNQRKNNQEPIEFLLENYRSKLISQEEYLKQKDYTEKLLETK